MDALLFQVKTSISFLGQAGVKGCCEVSYLSCHPLQCVPDWWQEGDKSCHPLLGLSARELHQAVSQRTVSAVPHGVPQQHHSQRWLGFLLDTVMHRASGPQIVNKQRWPSRGESLFFGSVRAVVGSIAPLTQSWLVSSPFPAVWQGMVRYSVVQDLGYSVGEPVEMVVTWELDSYGWLESGPPCLPCSHCTHSVGEHQQRVESRASAKRNSFLGVSGQAVGPGWGSHIKPGIMVVEKVSWKLRLHFSFTFFYTKCFGVLSLESVPALWSGGLVPWVWCEMPKSWDSA